MSVCKTYVAFDILEDNLPCRGSLVYKPSLSNINTHKERFVRNQANLETIDLTTLMKTLGEKEIAFEALRKNQLIWLKDLEDAKNEILGLTASAHLLSQGNTIGKLQEEKGRLDHVNEGSTSSSSKSVVIKGESANQVNKAPKKVYTPKEVSKSSPQLNSRKEKVPPCEIVEPEKKIKTISRRPHHSPRMVFVSKVKEVRSAIQSSSMKTQEIQRKAPTPSRKTQPIQRSPQMKSKRRQPVLRRPRATTRQPQAQGKSFHSTSFRH